MAASEALRGALASWYLEFCISLLEESLGLIKAVYSCAKGWWAFAPDPRKESLVNLFREIIIFFTSGLV